MNDTSEALRAQHRAAGDRVLIRGRRMLDLLDRIELERKFNQFWLLQPRVPAGQPDGGQWTDGDSQAGLFPINSEGADFRIDLRQNDFATSRTYNRPHTIDLHVAQSDDALRTQVRRSMTRIPHPDAGIEEIFWRPSGTFATVEDAERLINEAIQIRYGKSGCELGCEEQKQRPNSYTILVLSLWDASPSMILNLIVY